MENVKDFQELMQPFLRDTKNVYKILSKSDTLLFEDDLDAFGFEIDFHLEGIEEAGEIAPSKNGTERTKKHSKSYQKMNSIQLFSQPYIPTGIKRHQKQFCNFLRF